MSRNVNVPNNSVVIVLTPKQAAALEKSILYGHRLPKTLATKLLASIGYTEVTS